MFPQTFGSCGWLLRVPRYSSRPIAAYGSLDQPTYKVDLTPFVPLLSDGLPHNITLDVVSAETDHSILGNWFLSGNIQLVLDPSPKRTTGSFLSYSAPAYATTKTTGVVTPQSNGSYNDVNITVSAKHSLEIVSKIITGSGKVTVAEWSQDLSFKNFESFTQDANYQVRSCCLVLVLRILRSYRPRFLLDRATNIFRKFHCKTQWRDCSIGHLLVPIGHHLLQHIRW